MSIYEDVAVGICCNYCYNFFMLILSYSLNIRAFDMQFFNDAGTDPLFGNWIGDFNISLNFSKFYTFPHGKFPYKIYFISKLRNT